MKTSQCPFVLAVAISIPTLVACGDNGEVLASRNSETDDGGAGSVTTSGGNQGSSTSSASSGTDHGNTGGSSGLGASNSGTGGADAGASAASTGAVGSSGGVGGVGGVSGASSSGTGSSNGGVGGSGASDSGGGAGGTGEDTTPEDRCLASGGSVEMRLCCAQMGEFPTTCTVGSCSCSPASSEMTFVCACPEGSCFDPDQGCVQMSE